MQLNRIYQVALNMDDLETTKQFYSEVLGARYIAHYEPPGILFFDFEGTRLMFEANAGESTLYFWVDDMDAALAELKGKGVTIDHGPVMIHSDDDGTFGPAGEKEWMAFFKDPGGNTLAVATRKA